VLQNAKQKNKIDTGMEVKEHADCKQKVKCILPYELVYNISPFFMVASFLFFFVGPYLPQSAARYTN